MTSQAEKTPATTLTMQIGRRRYQVASLTEASRMFCTARDKAMHRGVGGSSHTPTPMIYNGDRLIGYVSYNGRVWAGHPHDWQPGMKPLLETAA